MTNDEFPLTGFGVGTVTSIGSGLLALGAAAIRAAREQRAGDS